MRKVEVLRNTGSNKIKLFKAGEIGEIPEDNILAIQLAGSLVNEGVLKWVEEEKNLEEEFRMANGIVHLDQRESEIFSQIATDYFKKKFNEANFYPTTSTTSEINYEIAKCLDKVRKALFGDNS